MSQGYIIYVIDAETTGFDPELNEVIEISMSRLVAGEDNLYNEVEQKSWLLRALSPKTISDEALAKNGHKREDILGISKYGRENYKMPAEVISDIELWLMDDNVSSMDRVWAGQNAQFDIDHIQALWKKNGKPTEDEFPFAIRNGNRTVDTKDIVTLFDICTGRRRKAYALGQLVKACNVKKDKAHRADGDVRMTRDLLLFCINIIKQQVAEQFKDCYNAEDVVS